MVLFCVYFRLVTMGRARSVRWRSRSSMTEEGAAPVAEEDGPRRTKIYATVPFSRWSETRVPLGGRPGSSDATPPAHEIYQFIAGRNEEAHFVNRPRMQRDPVALGKWREAPVASDRFPFKGVEISLIMKM